MHFEYLPPGKIFCLVRKRIKARFFIDEYLLGKFKLASRLKKEMDLHFNDNCQSWRLQADGHYVLNRPRQNQEPRSVQDMLLEKLAV